MKNNLKLFYCILIPLIVGVLGGIVTTSRFNTWFLDTSQLDKPQNYLFVPVWICLYILMGISLFIVLESKDKVAKQKAISLFITQLFLTFIWSFVFFYIQLLGLAILNLLLIWLSVLSMTIMFYKIEKRAGSLNLPYLLWVSFGFTSFLNAGLYGFNGQSVI